jgi:hypothetical protein
VSLSGFNTQKQDFTNQIETLKTQTANLGQQCAVKDGVNQTLQTQNRDQQSTIDGCLSQAMKLLTPEELKVTPIFSDADNSNAAIRTVRWILLVKKVVTPVRMVVGW